jgi:hypothetical protein
MGKKYKLSTKKNKLLSNTESPVNKGTADVDIHPAG